MPDRDPEKLSLVRTAILVAVFIAIMAVLPSSPGSIRRDPDLGDIASIVIGLLVFMGLFVVIRPYRRSK